ncbi:MAG: trypsin-like peptidase domain-containing protein [Pseudomonadota bacterium]
MTLRGTLCLAWCVACAIVAAAPTLLRASPTDAAQSVVSVLPVWPGHAQGGAGARPGVAPEGSGVVILEGDVVATAWHVVEPADSIDVRLPDGRVVAAKLIAHDAPSDIALLRIEAHLPILEVAAEVTLAEPVCALGNAYGLGLSVSCGVVSALNVSEAGFNPVEDFVQTDAAANPGVSGGALVDADGRLVGMMSAIFASSGETNIGVNFAVSSDLLLRVGEALLERGGVVYPSPGWRLERPDREQLAKRAGAVVAEIEPDRPAALAGVEPGDLITRIGEREVRKPRDVLSAIAVARPADGPIAVVLERNGQERELALALDALSEAQQTGEAVSGTPVEATDCPHPEPVCRARQGVFPISSFDPIASATRIGPDLLVTNRHVVGNRADAVVYTPAGPRGATVAPTAYEGDLALLRVDGLPVDGIVFSLERAVELTSQDAFFAVGADVARQEVRVFDPGGLLLPPAEGAALARLHVASLMQPGVSGGALVDATGALAGIAVGGGDRRYEAIPIEDVREAIALQKDPMASATQEALGEALAQCAAALDGTDPRRTDKPLAEVISEPCLAAKNQGLLLEAGRSLAQAGAVEAAIALHQAAVDQTPNSINARISLLVSMQLGGRFPDMTMHARWLMQAAPDDPTLLRFAIQAGIWGDEPELAEEAYARLAAADPRQAEAARRFIDNAPPAPPRR